MTRIKSRQTVCTLVAALAIGACAHDYVYTPEAANAVAKGAPAERTPIPQEAPTGSVEVASYGVTELAQNGVRVPALHVRMIVSNDGDATPWTLATNQQLVEIPNEGKSAPIYVNSDIRTLPTVTVGQHERHVLDLYYQLPDGITKESQLAGFSLLWQVNTPARQVASRATFDRIDRQATDVAAGGVYDDSWPLWAGYGPYWWYDPMYIQTGFVHVHPAHFHGGGVRVGHFGGGYHPSHFHAHR